VTAVKRGDRVRITHTAEEEVEHVYAGGAILTATGRLIAAGDGYDIEVLQPVLHVDDVVVTLEDLAGAVDKTVVVDRDGDAWQYDDGEWVLSGDDYAQITDGLRPVRRRLRAEGEAVSAIAGPLAFVIDEVEKTVNERHVKYGPGNIAGSPGGPLNGLRVRLHDKLARINHAIDTGELVDFTDDAFRDAFVDIVGYGLIGLLVVDGQWPDSDTAETVEPEPEVEDRTPFAVEWPYYGEVAVYTWDPSIARWHSQASGSSPFPSVHQSRQEILHNHPQVPLPSWFPRPGSVGA
jgi:hypothetical protein